MRAHYLIGLLLEGYEIAKVVGLVGQMEGPQALESGEAKGWEQSFGGLPPHQVISLFAEEGGVDEVSALVRAIYREGKVVKEIDFEGEPRYYTLYHGLKVMQDPASARVAFDVADKGYVKGL